MASARFVIFCVVPISMLTKGLNEVVSKFKVFMELFVNAVRFPVSETVTLVFPETVIIYRVSLIIEVST